jgi:hypothetical protein
LNMMSIVAATAKTTLLFPLFNMVITIRFKVKSILLCG